MRLSLRNKKRQDLLLTGFNVRAALFFFFNLSYLTLFLFWRWCNTWSHAGFANAKDTSEAFLLADMLYCAWKLLIRRHTRTRLFFFFPIAASLCFFHSEQHPGHVSISTAGLASRKKQRCDIAETRIHTINVSRSDGCQMLCELPRRTMPWSPLLPSFFPCVLFICVLLSWPLIAKPASIFQR